MSRVSRVRALLARVARIERIERIERARWSRAAGNVRGWQRVALATLPMPERWQRGVGKPPSHFAYRLAGSSTGKSNPP